MDTLQYLLDLFLHVDQHLDTFVKAHGPLAYGLIALIVFCETGLVCFPFLPGDSLLFAAGAIAARGTMDIWALMTVLLIAAIVGDNTNYLIGRTLGKRMLANPNGRFLNRKNFDRTHVFVEKHGGKSVLLGRFVPIVRTFCPFVAGVGRMDYRRFFIYDTAGAVLWVGVCCGAGYQFGNIPVIKDNFELAVIGVIAISILPLVISFIRGRLAARSTRARSAPEPEATKSNAAKPIAP